MIAKIIDENSVSAIPEDADDLLALRRIVRQGDRVVGDTTRVLKQERDYSRPDKGERVRVRIALVVEKISLDGVLDRLRIGGVISESSNESIPHGSHHAMTWNLGQGMTISKKRWTPVEKRLLRSGGGQTGFVLVAIDTSECGIARLRGTHLEFVSTIRSGAGGKRYKTSFNIEKFFAQVRQALAAVPGKGDTVVVFGPGETKKRLVNFMAGGQRPQGPEMIIAEGIDSAGEDGIYTFTKSEAMQGIMADSKLGRAAAIIDRVMILANKASKKFTMGYEETLAANRIGAVESLVFSEKILQDNDEQGVMDFLNDAEGKGVAAYSVDSSTDIGLRVAGLGGIVSLLRYAAGP